MFYLFYFVVSCVAVIVFLANYKRFIKPALTPVPLPTPHDSNNPNDPNDSNNPNNPNNQ